MKLKIGFTYDAKADYKLEPYEPPDKYAEFDSESTISEIENALKLSGNYVEKIGNAKALIKKIISGSKWDIIFNICEGISGRGRESQVPGILELFNIPYVGSDPVTMGITLDKPLAKKIVHYHGIKTPSFFVIENKSQINKLLNTSKLKFPLFVKPALEGTSKGITEKSLCRNSQEVKEYSEELINKYRQPVVVEEFIAGYEFTVLVIGNDPPEVLPPVQISIKGKEIIDEDFYTYDRVQSDEIKYFCPEKYKNGLKKKLKEMALSAYKVLGCRDVSRFDIRVNHSFEPYFLECNPLPNMGKIDVFPLVAEKTKRTYEELILLILQAGLKRYNIL